MAALARDTQRLFGKCDPSTRAPLPDADRQAIYTDLMRTAHSLKGGAAIAQLPHLSRLAHQLEDLLEALGQGRIENIQPACALLSRGIEHVDLLVAAAMRAGDIGEAETAATLAIYDELDQLLSVLPVHTEADAMADITPAAPNASVLKSALSVDLEECLQRVETQIGSSASPARVQEVLANFTEECLLLAQVLSQTWLSELAEGLRTVAATASPELSEMAIATVSAIREQRDLVLVDMGASPVIPTPTASPGNTPIADLLADTERLPESNSTPDAPDLFGPSKLTELEGEQLPSNIGERLNPLPQESSEEEAFDVLAILEPNTAAPTFFDELPDDLQSFPVEGEDFAFFDDLPDAVEPSPSETAEPIDMSEWDVGHSLNELDDIFGAAPEASVIEDPYSLMDVALDDSTIASEFIVGSHSVADDLGAAALDTSSATFKDEANADSVSNSSATEAAPVEVGSEFAPEAVAADPRDAPPAIAQTIPPDVSESALEHLISELGETAPPPKLDDSTALPVSDVSPVSEITSSLTSETGGAKLPGEDSNRRPHSVVLPRVRQSTAASQQPLPDLKLRMPVSRLDRIDNTLGELLIVRERLVERHRQLEAASRNLQIRAQQLSPINDRVREFYDRLAVEGHSTLPSSGTAAAIEDATLTEEATLSLKTSLASTTQDFDALEFDRYTDFHSTLQDLQELMVQVQESRADIDLISDGFHNALDDLRDRLGSL
ncbi:MAG: Hpt domain-containing protein, partial [Cyanobacteria bacterium P01_F01_bin.33]